ncbi:sentrin-specific protease 7-like [Xyrichtys novacula]|uniref:Sentrin-specific protease 7-like n=1 Tax=Xyrichtys novacula TaxID=13765 RepID=A0AAV1HLX5_XYRNO|nr:sentrin-specific protease 7-like [Xyrichtys novacula]
MASSFKIPKKKQSAGSDSAPLFMHSPLSRLQNPAYQIKNHGDQSNQGGAYRAPKTQESSLRNPREQSFREVVKIMLGINNPDRGSSTANQKATQSGGSKSQPGQGAGSSSAGLTNGWRPKRASDRLLEPADTSDPLSPPEKKKSDSRASPPPSKRISVKSVDSLAQLRAQRPAGSLSSLPWKRGEMSGDSAERKSDSSERNSSEDDFLSPSRVKLSAEKPQRKDPVRPSISTSTSGLDRTPGPTGGGSTQLKDLRERERMKWLEFRDRKRTSRTSILLPRQKKEKKQNPTEPIVLSSEDEGEAEDEGNGDQRTPQSSRDAAESRLANSEQKQKEKKVHQASSSRGQTDESPPPSFLQLEFSSLHAGLTHAHANGELLITENCIILPLKGEEEVEVTVVASQVRGYGVWDGGVARGGTLLAGWEGPAPSLLFLWVTESQARLLQTELSIIQTSNGAPGPPCSFLLLVLKEQLQELKAALLASILDMEEYRRGYSSSSSGCSSSPLEWTDGLLLLHSCPPPLDQHLLGLLGHSAEKSSQTKSNQRSNKLGLNSSVSSRLIQYPAAPCKGRISVSKEDLACLASGEFLNDVIIDFYLKYLLLEGVGGSVAERSHVFSSFFFKQLSRRRAAGEEDTPSIPDRRMRHHRVKTWTRHVDIFAKDFLFVPVNQEAHWFLVVVCFPGLEEVQYVEFQSPAGSLKEPKGKSSLSLRSQHPPVSSLIHTDTNQLRAKPVVFVQH